MVLDKTLIFLAHFVCSLISTAQFLGPFKIFGAAWSWVLFWTSEASIFINTIFICSDVRVVLDIALSESLGHLEGLFRSSQNVMHLSCRGQSSKNLILRWQVKLLHYTIKLLSKLQIFSIKLLVSHILLADQEPEILRFILGLPQNSFPSEFSCISIFFTLNQLEMQVVIFLYESLVFFLQWHDCLCIKLSFLCNNNILVLQLLECFWCLHNFIQEPLNKRSRFNICLIS